MASFSSSSSWPNPTKKWSYDVFLSFRGTDVRKGFVGHLYAALDRDGIRTFLDEDKIEYGEEIEAACLKGIQESRFSLVILSKDYASSTWCLEELVHILKCKEKDDVWPIFYDVDPSHVEEIKESYEKAFLDHEKRFKDDDLHIHLLHKWKGALQQVSYLKGLDLQKHLDGHEARNIDHIVKEISRRLNRKLLSVAIHPVGLKCPVQKVISLIAGEPEHVRIIGICGMGGIGKTTIAKEVYNSIFHEFESGCFLENVRELSVSKGLAYLQRQLLTETLKRKHEKIDNVDRGLNLIIEKLRYKRVLLVLDDVDKLDQLHKLLGKRDWFFPGTRVIITTRMKEFLQHSELYWQYEVQELSYRDSLQLLSMHAFDKSQPTEDYLNCAERVVRHVGGIPLALEVLGSSLRGENVDVWNSRLKKLEVVGNNDINNKLKISYDSLDDHAKFIFLDIACFFLGYKKDYVMSILDGCRFFPIDGINILMRRCLLKVDSNNRLLMHDLLRNMGREIVRQQHVTDPGDRSRLWHHEDVIDVLKDKTGTKAVEGIVLNMAGSKHSWSTKAFKKMKMLRLLQLNYVQLKGSFEYMSNKLRWLCWHEFPSESIPIDLGLENLVALDMRYSNLKQFSEEEKSLKKLKFLDLGHSRELIKTPDFEYCPNLEKLKLKDCTNLENIQYSIGFLTHLVFLDMRDCKNLRNLPGCIGDLKSLQKLNMSGCTKLEELPDSVGLLSHLIFLNLKDCENLKNLPASIGGLKSLEELNMSSCSQLEELPESIGFLTRLIFLNFLDCASLKNLPGRFGDLKSLKNLNMSGCLKLEDMPDSTGNLTSLIVWNMQDCKNLRNIPRSMVGLRSLKELNMSGCSKLMELPEDLGKLKSLVVLNLDGTAISTLPETIGNLEELKTLSLRECHLIFSPKNCPYNISFLPYSLKELDLGYCSIGDGIIPNDLRGLPFLTKLKLCGNHFTTLPSSIRNLTTLRSLSLNACKRLQTIPQLDAGLNELQANECTSLESINLRNSNDSPNLELHGCVNLKEIEGFFNLEPLDFEIAQILLGGNSSIIQESITNNVRICKINSLTKTNKMCPLQALSERDLYSIFLPGSEIPLCFSHQSEGDTVSFCVPPIDPGSKIIGIVTCALYAWRESCKSWWFFPSVTLVNRTKMVRWLYTPYITFLSSDVEQDIIWLCYWMFNVQGLDSLDTAKSF